MSSHRYAGQFAWVLLLALGLMLGGCQGIGTPLGSSVGLQGATPKVLAVESFLADIAQNVAGDRVKIVTLMPLGIDPHGFEPTPQDIGRIADANVLIVNGAGYEEWLQKVLDNAGGKREVIVASAGLASRTARAGELSSSEATDATQGAGDPHFWLDPTKVVIYVENVRDGLIQSDPAGKDTYTANAAAYIAKLDELDKSIADQIQQVPEARRLLVTNHESLGYFADRYGLRVVGAIIPSISTNASPSAEEMAHLVETIRRVAAPAVFLEANANPQLAEQISQETGIKVVTNLYTETLTPSDGAAPTYLDMMRYNARQIVEALE